MDSSLQQSRRPAPARTALLWSGRFAGHLLGVCLVGALMAVAFFDQKHAELFWQAAHYDSFLQMASWDLTLFAGLSVSVWGLGCLVVTLGRRRIRALGQSRRHHRLGVRGSVMIETLMVLPILLVLIGGLAQLAVINMAGVFANLATFEAGRSVWVWEGEPCNASGECDTREMAKIQAAAVLTPVAPGDFVFQDASGSDEMEKMRGILIASQYPWPIADSGFSGMSHAETLASTSSASRRTANFAAAFDTSSFVMRSARKFTFAYHAVDVDYNTITRDGRPALEIDLTYKQHCAFPFVETLFGERDTVAGRNGFYSIIERQYVHVRQPQANRAYPEIDPSDATDRGGVRLF